MYHSDNTKKHTATNTVLEQPTTARKSTPMPIFRRPLNQHITFTMTAPPQISMNSQTTKQLLIPPQPASMTTSQLFIKRPLTSTTTSQQTWTPLLPRLPTFTAPLNYHPAQSFPQPFITRPYLFIHYPYQRQKTQELNFTPTWLLILTVTFSDRFLNLFMGQTKVIYFNLILHIDFN